MKFEETKRAPTFARRGRSLMLDTWIVTGYCIHTGEKGKIRVEIFPEVDRQLASKIAYDSCKGRIVVSRILRLGRKKHPFLR